MLQLETIILAESKQNRWNSALPVLRYSQHKQPCAFWGAVSQQAARSTQTHVAVVSCNSKQYILKRLFEENQTYLKHFIKNACENNE